VRLQDLQGTYSSVVSLGRSCLTALHLEENKLRTFASVIDWMLVPELASINYLIKHRFERFMDLENMRIVGKYNQQYIVYDEVSHIYSYHDFSRIENSVKRLHTYPEFKMKLDKRINRFLSILEQDDFILFVRIQGLYRDVKNLQQVLSESVKHDYRVLIVNEGSNNQIKEIDWGLDKICVIEIPYTEIHPFVNADLWGKALGQIRVKT